MRERNLAEVVIRVKLGMLARSKVSWRPDAKRTSENTAEGGGDKVERR